MRASKKTPTKTKSPAPRPRRRFLWRARVGSHGPFVPNRRHPAARQFRQGERHVSAEPAWRPPSQRRFVPHRVNPHVFLQSATRAFNVSCYPPPVGTEDFDNPSTVSG